MAGTQKEGSLRGKGFVRCRIYHSICRSEVDPRHSKVDFRSAVSGVEKHRWYHHGLTGLHVQSIAGRKIRNGTTTLLLWRGHDRLEENGLPLGGLHAPWEVVCGRQLVGPLGKAHLHPLFDGRKGLLARVQHGAVGRQESEVVRPSSSWKVSGEPGGCP